MGGGGGDDRRLGRAGTGVDGGSVGRGPRGGDRRHGIRWRTPVRHAAVPGVGTAEVAAMDAHPYDRNILVVRRHLTTTTHAAPTTAASSASRFTSPATPAGTAQRTPPSTTAGTRTPSTGSRQRVSGSGRR